jgi:hypothetical protein
MCVCVCVLRVACVHVYVFVRVCVDIYEWVFCLTIVVRLLVLSFRFTTLVSCLLDAGCIATPKSATGGTVLERVVSFCTLPERHVRLEINNFHTSRSLSAALRLFFADQSRTEPRWLGSHGDRTRSFAAPACSGARFYTRRLPRSFHRTSLLRPRAKIPSAPAIGVQGGRWARARSSGQR